MTPASRSSRPTTSGRPPGTRLWGNMTVNPISALTGASMGPMLADDLVTGLIEAVMLEAREVGARIGCPIDETPAARVDVTRRLGDLEPSMLQDARAGRRSSSTR
nr:ketopantoate reductase C-terminal domain-containing protein [Angustibacter aerolatus]